MCIQLRPFDSFACVKDIGFNIASNAYVNDVLSSKSVNRFLVHFQTKNRMMPSAEIPPATESPTIEPVLRPPLLGLFEVPVWEGAALETVKASGTSVVTSCPEASVAVVGTAELTTIACVDGAATEVA